MKIKIILIFLFSVYSNLLVLTPKEIVTKLSLNPATKAIMQWERVL